MNTYDVISRFQNRQPHRRTGRIEFQNSTGTVSCTDKVLYSYREPMAVYLPRKGTGKDDLFVKSGDRWSVTTSSHQRNMAHLPGPVVSFNALNAAGIDPKALTAKSIVDYSDGMNAYVIRTKDERGRYSFTDYWTKHPWKRPAQGMFIPDRQQNRNPHMPMLEENEVSGHWHILGGCVIEAKVCVREAEYEWHTIPTDACGYTVEAQQKREAFRVLHDLSPYSPTNYGRDGRQHVRGRVLREALYQKRHFLCALDEGSYFVSALPRKVKSVAEAFDVLKPLAVKQAEAAGIKVLRQGEWFFIPTLFDDSVMASARGMSKTAFLRQTEIKALPKQDPSSNDHVVRQYVSGQKGSPIRVRGTVYHRDPMTGRGTGEHASVKLGDLWHEAHRNTERASWSMGGTFD